MSGQRETHVTQMPPATLAWMGAGEVAEAVRRGLVSPQEVVAAHLERIARLDPQLGAYVHVDPEAKAGFGPLAGVTLAVKDTQPVAGMPLTLGSRRWRDRIAAEDAVAVARVRTLGVAVLGKTNTPELAASIGTLNEIFGPTHNPWRRGWTPGGSSGGSAAAVAAGLAALAFGDDMGGSIRIPAACCGVVGLRPTPRRVPEEHPDPTGLCVPGPLARSVADVRLGLSVMTAEPPPPPARRRLQVAVVDSSPLGAEPACLVACRRAAQALQSAGHRLRPATWEPVAVAEAYRVVRPASLAIFPGPTGEYGDAVRELISRGRATPVVDLLASLQAGLRAAAALRRLLDPGACDAVLTPTLGRQPMPIEEVPPFLSEDWCSYTQFVLPVSFAGLPALSLPAGRAGGLPVGVQLVGRPHGEWELLELAEELESMPDFGFQRPQGFD